MSIESPSVRQMNNLADSRCPVCDCEYVVLVREVPTKRTNKLIPLYCCLRCRSFSNPSGYDDKAAWFLQAALDWHNSVHERNVGYSNQLFDHLLPFVPLTPRILEIGCGTGTLLKVARERGAASIKGYDLNPLAVDYGRAEYQLDLVSEVWTDRGQADPFDLVLCISVLEHLERPRDLLGEICSYCRRMGAKAYISVPFLEQTEWHFLKNPDPTLEKTPFFDNDCHVTHFSRYGLRLVSEEFGAKEVEEVWGGAWRGFLISF